MSNRLRLSVRWDCPGDELSPHRHVVLNFFDDQKEITRAFSLKEVGERSLTQPPLGRQILRWHWQMMLDAGMVSEDDEGLALLLIDRALAFAMADTSSQNHTRRTMLQVIGSPEVVVKTEETNWQPTKVSWQADL